MLDLGKIPLLVVTMIVPVAVLVGMERMQEVMMRRIVVVMMMSRSQVNIELGPGDQPALRPAGMKVVSFQAQFLHPVFELMKIHAQIEHRADEHIAADAAK